MKLKLGLLALSVSALVACDSGIDPNSPVGKRKAIFKEMLNVSEDLGGMLRGRVPYDEALFIEQAAHLDQLGRTPWQYFPELPEADKSSAKADVWEQQEKFKQLAREMEQATANLVASTQATPIISSALKQRMQAVEDSCESCHQAFRAY
ncbi:cytochrome C [Thiopseudomonas alkaliphila]|uniref:Cytochrome c n=1 Tax=Thiopseudomonas alkaliphila TaxID=1697053 RepID=A0AAW7DTM7_9GAMM|nr:cytochrome c [Thiopseudomonas alkaliphila]AKX45146.1 cytochrome C [Thiopseudomonas alkaliphila]AKX47313.1 cytochrome C [Thiopseudomonas alkaliphila]AKX48465.1 cytochrome C [Thiopseudomonas alkaliphila]AKX55442.1 cytochrome C [Thiopseudomonas alkaliphila]MDM1697161.1 cytochrome c [Thiopseudomonas alkaliphila]